MIYLHKILPALVSPLGLCLLMVLIGLILNARRWVARGIVILIVCALPATSNMLWRQLEQGHELQDPAQAPTASAIVVLSGMLRAVQGGDDFTYEWSEAADRYFAGVALALNMRAPKLIFTRGAQPWSAGAPEGEILYARARKDLVPEGMLDLTPAVENTAQEAKAVAAMLERGAEIILVTSAFHMPRAEALFREAGLEVTPWPVDFRASANKITTMDFIPSAGGLSGTSAALREFLGRAYYAYLK
jgi:uncharacterized SAM-binding protein YcdF (DUF218 family)